MHILIDTCIWKKLVVKNQVSEDLKLLLYLAKNSYIKILVPEPLLSEWNKHRQKEIDDIEKAIEKQAKTITLLRKDFLPLEPSEHERAKEYLQTQVDIIDEIIYNISIHIPKYENIKKSIFERIENRKPPFHNKIDSLNDAYIIFSTLEYLDNNNLNELIFITDNKTDFANPKNDDEIHPDILRDYDRIGVTYFQKINSFITYLKEHLSTPIEDSPYDSSPTKEIFVDKTLPIIDQIYSYLKERFEEISYVPPQILVNNFPFKIGKDYQPHYYDYSVRTDNEELFNFFEKLNDQDLIQLAEDKIKIEFIKNRLHRNMLIYIKSEHQNKTIEIKHKDNKQCDCNKCIYYRFEYPEILVKEDNNLHALLEKAYINYRIGNFNKAVKEYQIIEENAKIQKKNVIQFIAKFNQSKLLVFARNRYRTDNNIIKELKKIDLDKDLASLKNSKQIAILTYLRNHNFLHDSIKNLTEIVTSIRNDYYTSINGGWSRNSNTISLLNEFIKMDLFLNSNYIIYDHFLDFAQIFELFTEGLIASHAIPETSESSRLSIFNEYIISTLIYYGETEKILKHIRRYKLSNIKTGKIDSNHTLSHIFKNYFGEFEKHQKFINSIIEENNNFYWNNFSTVINNTLTLTSYLDIKKADINKYFKSIISFANNHSALNHNNAKRIEILVRKKGNLVTKKSLLELLELAIKSKKLRNAGIVSAVAYHLHNKSVILSSECLDIILSDLPETYSIDLFEALHPKQRTILKNSIISNLKANFNSELYYLATLYDIIDPHLEEFFDKFLSLTSLQVAKKGLVPDSKNRYYRVNELINICYKYNINTDNISFDTIRNIDKYYEWLLDIDNFNYEDFDPNWVSEYVTRFYFRRFYHSEAIKTRLLRYIQKNENQTLKENYLGIIMRGELD